MSQVYPSVDVVCWTDTSFWIRCPYCEDLHHHGFVSYESARRAPHCNFQRPSYECVFPGAYEIDKAKARFVNILTLSGLDEDSEDTESFCGEFSRLELSNTATARHPPSVSFDDSTEMATIQLGNGEAFKQRRITLAISYCVTGKVPKVEHYLKTSPDKSIFLHGKDQNGDTSLIMASQEKSSSMVSLLLEYGAEVNATNRDERTALMEASLWGRLKSVEILLSQGANRYLLDNSNRTAADLSQPTRKNQKERHIIAGGAWGDPSKEPLYKEDVISRDADRREIARILEEKEIFPHVRTENRKPVPEAAYHSFRRSPDDQSIIHYGPIREYPTTRPKKTIALLERGNPFPTVPAMSGWGHSEWLPTRVSGEDWTQRVIQLAAIVGHTMSADLEKDRGIQGRFQASHAEKQLIAYFVDRHVFLPAGIAPDPGLEHLQSEMAAIVSNCPIISQLYELENKKKKLEIELLNKDHHLLGEEYDEDLVERLKTEFASLSAQIGSLEMRSEVKKIRTQEEQIQVLERKQDVQDRLNRLSKMAPKDALSEATILISSPSRGICDDCLLFKSSINRVLGLSIKLQGCTK